MDTRRKMVAWDFDVRCPDGSVRRENFYAKTRDEAARIARGWATRMGYELDEELLEAVARDGRGEAA